MPRLTLADVSDAELMAEVRARGLLPDERPRGRPPKPRNERGWTPEQHAKAVFRAAYLTALKSGKSDLQAQELALKWSRPIAKIEPQTLITLRGRNYAGDDAKRADELIAENKSGHLFSADSFRNAD